MTDDARREVLRRAVGGVLFNASNYPAKVQRLILGQDTRPLTDKIVDAILAVDEPTQPIRIPTEADWDAVRTRAKENPE